MVELQLLRGIDRTRRATENYTLSLFAGESLLGALTDEIALDFGGKTEGKGEDFALNVVAEAVVVLNRPHAALLRHADIQDLHNHKEVPAKARKFAADNDVVLVNALQEYAQLPLRVILRAADGLLNPVVNHEVMLFAKLVNLKTLVLNCLFVAADANVTVNHR